MKFSRILLSLLLTAVISPASAAMVKPGDACSKLGNVVLQGSIKYKCVNIGKKKIWDKGSLIEPISFDDLVTHPESVTYWAWKKSSSQIIKSEKEMPSIEMHVGPNTKLLHALTSRAILNSSRLYSEFTLPKTVHAIYYTYKDVAWAQREFAKYAFRPIGDETKNSCRSEKTCWGGMAEIDLKGNAILIFGVMSSNKDSNHTSGSLESHEFTHAIQGTQFIGTQKEESAYCCTPAYMPWWMVEGGAEFSQAVSTFPNSYKEYLEERVRDTNQLLANRDNKFTTSWIAKFLEPSSRSMWADSQWDGRTYDLGYLANEAFVALKGPQISMQLFRDVALGSTWQEAFAKNFGLSWEDALPVLSKAIKAQIGK